MAADLVTTGTEANISNAIPYFSGNVLVVDTIGAALCVQCRTGRYYRIVTLDEDTTSPGGNMMGGTRNTKNNSSLATNVEIDKLVKRVRAGKEKFAELEMTLDELNHRLPGLQTELATKDIELSPLSQKISE